MEVFFHKNFEKKLKKLSVKIQSQFDDRLGLFVEDKFDVVLNNHSVEKIFPGCRSINITGDYRAIFKEEADIVIFISIGTHSELYE